MTLSTHWRMMGILQHALMKKIMPHLVNNASARHTRVYSYANGAHGSLVQFMTLLYNIMFKFTWPNLDFKKKLGKDHVNFTHILTTPIARSPFSAESLPPGTRSDAVIEIQTAALLPMQSYGGAWGPPTSSLIDDTMCRLKASFFLVWIRDAHSRVYDKETQTGHSTTTVINSKTQQHPCFLSW